MKSNTYHILALAISVGLVFHGASFLSTLGDTYDIYVHIFFGQHYKVSWFEPWETRWYTGFSLISYPPLTHQLIALLSFVGGLKFSAYLLGFGIVFLYVTGAYRFAKLITANKESAAYAALIAVFLPSVVETFHVFGQFPMMMGISWLLHALPPIYAYIRTGKVRYYLAGISLISVAVCSHHVTPIFGMVFFVAPLMATAIMDAAKEESGMYKDISIMLFLRYVRKFFFRIGFFGFSAVLATILLILPYWIWSKNDPIAQVPIPHGSRDSFIEVFSSGLVFFIIPWGFLFLMLPFYFYRYFSKRNVFLGLSFTMLFVLGTGGTTPVPRMLLGENAFNILTLERFTFWATIYAMPLTGEFLWRFTRGDIYAKIRSHRSPVLHVVYTGILIVCIFFSAGFTTNLSFFRPLQPEPLSLTPLKNFLQSDKHYKWRFLTLGFGDQMAWLSSNTTAKTIDGNYHSARRVPELTTRAVERLENAKYRGIEGIVTLQQFLSSPESFHLKYILSNDKFYDPILYFTGWHRVKFLTNGVMVWERSDVSQLPAILPKKEIPVYQKLLWGVVPLSTLLAAFFFNIQIHWTRHILGKRREKDFHNPEEMRQTIAPVFYYTIKYWIALVIILALLLIGNIYWLNMEQAGHERVVTSYYNALDFKEFEKAHAYLDPNENMSLDYFLLEKSVTDGLLDSYGKLNSIRNKTLVKRHNYAKIKSSLEWVTSINTVIKEEVHEVVRYGWKWYIKPKRENNFIPVNQFSEIPSNHYLNQGRRKITTRETFHEDVLDRPVTIVTEANLIKRDSTYHVVGTIQNVDSYPVDLTIKASLIDSAGNRLTSYYDQYDLIHKLNSKQETGFRIDFESVTWALSGTPEATPANFEIEVLGTVTTTDLYTKVLLMDLMHQGAVLTGNLYNYGTMTSTITQIIKSYYDAKGKLYWVDSSFPEKSVFPGKGAFFSTVLLNEDYEIVTSKEMSIKINGTDNQDITEKYNSRDEIGGSKDIYLDDGRSLKLYLNNFIGNSTNY